MSRATISRKKKISRLRETDDKLFPQTTAETRNFGRLVLPFEFLTISIKDMQCFVDSPSGNEVQLMIHPFCTGSERDGFQSENALSSKVLINQLFGDTGF
ncbi:hypothetical protein ACB092_07G141300 [Castanea dentata]